MPTFEILQNQGSAACLPHLFRDRMSHFGAASARFVSTKFNQTSTDFFRMFPPKPVRHERKTHCAMTQGTCADMSHSPPEPVNAAMWLLKTPPRMWGRHFPVTRHLSEAGNTPTNVGKTRAGRGCSLRSQKHPHKVGKTCFSGLNGNTAWKHPHKVGKTALFPLDFAFTWKHPHKVGKTLAHANSCMCPRKHPHKVRKTPTTA